MSCIPLVVESGIFTALADGSAFGPNPGWTLVPAGTTSVGSATIPYAGSMVTVSIGGQMIGAPQVIASGHEADYLAVGSGRPSWQLRD